MNQDQFAVSVLRRLGIRPSASNMKMMRGWMAAEGGHWNNDAYHNPLNTTQPMKGAGNTGTQGNIKQYRDWNQGIEATVKTIRNGRYGPIIQALKSKDPSRFVSAIGTSPWGTHAGLVAKTVGAAPAKVPLGSTSSSPQAGRPPSARAAGAVTPTAAPAPPQEPSKKALLADYLARKNPNSGLVKALRLSAALEASTPTQTPPSAPQGARGPSPKPTGPRPQGMSRLLELFHDPVGGWKGRTPIGPIGGHGRHVHAAAGPKTTIALAKLAQQMGLHVGEHPKYGGVAPVHTKGSYHYRRKGQAIDVSGDPQKMKAYTQRILKLYGIPAR